MNFEPYLFIPFKEKGRDWSGCDCWGLVRLVYKEQLDIELPEFNGYKTLKDREVIDQMIEGNIGHWIEIPAGEEQIGDGVLMRLLGRPHMGVVCRVNHVLHTNESGATTEDYTRPNLRNRVIGFRRYVP